MAKQSKRPTNGLVISEQDIPSGLSNFAVKMIREIGLEEFIRKYKIGEITVEMVKNQGLKNNVYFSIDRTNESDNLLKCYANLLVKVFGQNCKHVVLYSIKNLMELIQTLDPKRKDILESHFGLIDGKPQILKKIAPKYKVSTERIRKIEEKLISKLYENKKIIYIDINTEQNDIFNIIKNNNTEELRRLVSSHVNTDDLDEDVLNFAKGLYNSIKIKKLNLSTRAYNCLAREGIENIGNFIGKTKGDIEGIRSLGTNTANEIFGELEKLGIIFNKEGKITCDVFKALQVLESTQAKSTQRDTRELIEIQELNLSTRAYNCLTREGIENVGNLIGKKRDYIEAIRNLGISTANEIFSELEKLGVVFIENENGDEELYIEPSNSTSIIQGNEWLINQENVINLQELIDKQETMIKGKRQANEDKVIETVQHVLSEWLSPKNNIFIGTPVISEKSNNAQTRLITAHQELKDHDKDKQI